MLARSSRLSKAPPALRSAQISRLSLWLGSPLAPSTSGHRALRCRLLSRKDDGFHPVLLGRVLGRGLPEPEAADHPGANPLEPHTLEQLKELSLRESTANSAGPELGVVHDRLGEWTGADHIDDRHPTTGPQDAENLRDHLALPEGEIDDPVRDDHVGETLVDRRLLDSPFAKLGVGDAELP